MLSVQINYFEVTRISLFIKLSALINLLWPKGKDS
jgi:hypothetical protein